MRTSWFALLVLAAFPVLTTAQAAGIADPQQGYKLAQVECASCHVIDPEPRKSLADLPPRSPGAAPHFKSIAFDPEMTPDKMRDILRLPHGEMANVLLAEKDIDNIISYIVGMRRTVTLD